MMRLQSRALLLAAGLVGLVCFMLVRSRLARLTLRREWKELGAALPVPEMRVLNAGKQAQQAKRGGAAGKGTAEGGLNIEGSSCNVPKLDMHDPSVDKFFHATDPLKCRPEPNWVVVTDAKLVITDAAVAKHGKVTCDYIYFWRESDHKLGQKTVKNFPSGTALLGDYAKVNCVGADKAAFTNVYATVMPDAEAIARAHKTGTPKDWSGLSMYMAGFDSISRMTFIRKMPKVYEYLTKHLEGAVLEGYNIVGDGTPQAFIPILTAQTEEELPLTRKRFPEAKYVDVYPMIWKDFAAAGYVTMYGEDSSAVGTFTYRLKGFDKQPTDHYFRTFYQQAEHEYSKHPKLCFGSEGQHTAWFRYGEQFFTNYAADLPKFSLLHHSALSHDDLNTFEIAQEDFLAHLNRLEKAGHLNRTLLIVMADHGHRFAQLRSTHQGQLEERLPVFIIVAPKWWREGVGKKAWANLLVNRNRLTTPFDIHPTLMRLIHWKEPGVADLSKRSVALWDEIPETRICPQAGVDAHWCTCLNWEPLKESDEQALRLAKVVVNAINMETERQRRLCVVLKLVEILSVNKLMPNADLLKYKNVKDKDGFVPDLSGDTHVDYALYQIKLRTMPGDALYEATVSYDFRVKRATVDLNTISHINKYGENPHCVIDNDYWLAKWCVCHDMV